MVTKSNFFNESLVKIKIKLEKVFSLNVEKKTYSVRMFREK